MAIPFNCPSCKAYIQVGDELAGQTGECPRCKRFVVIPSSTQPMPVLLDDEGRPVPILTPVKTDPKAKTPAYDDRRGRARRPQPVEKKPSGPTWPWAIGILAGIAVLVLLFISFLTLFIYRPAEPRANVIIVESKAPADFRGVRVGRQDGQRIFLDNGVFQTRTALQNNDEVNPRNFASRRKSFEVDLKRATAYVIEMDSLVLSSSVYVEKFNMPLAEAGNKGAGNVRLEFTPPDTDRYMIHATTANPGTGEFTLTIREAHLPKPGP